MDFTTSRPGTFQRMVGVLALLIVFVLVLISYAIVAGWSQPRSANESRVSGAPEGTVSGASLEVPTQPPAPATVIPTQGVFSRSRVGIEDGYIPDGVVLSPMDTDHPAIANLDPGLLDAIQRAAADANVEGIEMVINSGWRSQRYQQAMLDEAVVTYGSEEEARKWVNSPDKSSHVMGDAVDIGYTDADYWLIQHGNKYGLCQTYENEIWHFELTVEPGEPCPPPLSDATASIPGDSAVREGHIISAG